MTKARITGIVITTLCVLFFLFDGTTKVFKESHSIEGSVQLGWPENLVPILGVLLLFCTLLYVLPRTAVLGAVLLTAYLGGATATMVRVHEPFFFQVIVGLLVWLGLYLREQRLRTLLPLVKPEQA